MSDGRQPLSPGRKRLYTLLMLGLTFLLAEGATRLLYALHLPRFEIERRRLAGEPLPVFQKSLRQPYLLYVPLPNYVEEGRTQHNAQGYRGVAVPMKRTPNVARVLCMGGSTTYGWANPFPDQTYPAHLQRILTERMPDGVEGVEVINAGLPYGTTAEMITHYHFKFHYFRPDLVIINTGGNDAHAMVHDYYQPDYSHWRQTPTVTQALPPHSRWLMRSRLVSLGTILFLRGAAPPPSAALLRPSDAPPEVRWYPELERRAGRDIPREELAFAHNLETLIEMIRRDGAQVLLVPFRPAPVHNYSQAIMDATARNEQLLYRIADERGLMIAPFPLETISPEHWLDNCHENAAGSRQKAAHIADYASRLLWP